MEGLGREIDILLRDLKGVNKDLAVARMFGNKEVCQELISQKNEILKEIDAENNKLLQAYSSAAPKAVEQQQPEAALASDNFGELVDSVTDFLQGGQQESSESQVALLDEFASQKSWRGKLTRLKNNFTASVMKLNPKVRARQSAEHTQNDDLGLNR